MRSPLVYLTVLVVATCGLVYELVAGTLASYVLGDSVTQFSTVIGVYLSALGVGSYVSRYVQRGLARRFVEVELAVALLGGISAPLLFLAFAHFTGFFRPVLYGVVLVVGTLVGLEIPLVLRILRDTVDFRELVAKVLTFDYLGALFASVLFPVFFVPQLGLVRTSVLFGLANAGVGLWSTWLFAPLLGPTTGLRIKGAAVILALLVAFANAERLTDLAEEGIYQDAVVFAKSTPYQRIVITRSKGQFQLFLNGNLQFSSADEYRYHEALVHPAMGLAPNARRVLVLGGGDGLAVREILKHPGVREVVLVDLDPEMTRLAHTNPLLRELNQRALDDPRVSVVNQDAFVWLDEARPKAGLFDVAIVDFPDPHNFSIGKLYTTRFYSLLRGVLDPAAAVAVQTTSPLMARKSYWSINHTLEAVGFHVHGYHALVPAFGEWGFALAAARAFEPPTTLLPGLRYLDAPTLASLFVMGPDMAETAADVNRLNNQVLVRYYEEEWARWN
jgi:spermidine synthase